MPRRIVITAIAVMLAFAVLPQRVFAHGGEATSGEISAALTTWSIDPLPLLLIGFVAGLYVWALRRLKRTAPRLRFSRWRPVAFFLGLLVLLVALVSPIDAYGDDLFWAHMLQHVLVIVAAAPLLILGAPVTLALAASTPRLRHTYLRPFLRSRLLAALMFPPVTLTIFIGVTWLWHLPAIYDAAIDVAALHAIEHGSFLGVALLFWWLIIDVDPIRFRPSHLIGAVSLFVVIVQGVLLGAILVTLDEPIYDTYISASALRDWGPTALADQRAGAGLVWIPGGLVFALAFLVTLHGWIARLELEADRDDTRRRRPSPSGVRR
jgi:cytochrome c oxidase assembly factor CtaG